MRKRNVAGQKHILEAISLGSAHVPRPCLWLWPKHRVIQAQRAGVWGPTYTEEEALVFLDGPQAAEEARHHDNGAYGDD